MKDSMHSTHDPASLPPLTLTSLLLVQIDAWKVITTALQTVLAHVKHTWSVKFNPHCAFTLIVFTSGQKKASCVYNLSTLHTFECHPTPSATASPTMAGLLWEVFIIRLRCIDCQHGASERISSTPTKEIKKTPLPLVERVFTFQFQETSISKGPDLFSKHSGDGPKMPALIETALKSEN